MSTEIRHQRCCLLWEGICTALKLELAETILMETMVCLPQELSESPAHWPRCSCWKGSCALEWRHQGQEWEFTWELPTPQTGNLSAALTLVRSLLSFLISSARTQSALETNPPSWQPAKSFPQYILTLCHSWLGFFVLTPLGTNSKREQLSSTLGAVRGRDPTPTGSGSPILLTWECLSPFLLFALLPSLLQKTCYLSGVISSASCGHNSANS